MTAAPKDASDAAWSHDWVERRFGLDVARYGESTRATLRRRLSRAGSESDAIAAVIEACCIGETSFFRHPEQLRILKGRAADLPSARDGNVIRAWSAGCSTGEEAYSIASVLRSATRSGVSVLGTDVDARKLEHARGGRYSAWSLRGVDEDFPQDAWRRIGNDFEIVPRIRDAVAFTALNLVSDPYPNGFDVVLCRNVLLYFTDRSVTHVLEHLAESVLPGGLLLLGPFDPILDPLPETLVAVDAQRHVYRRRVAPIVTRRSGPVRRSTLPPPPTSAVFPRISPREPSGTETQVDLDSVKPAPSSDSPSLYLRVEELVEQGDAASAIALLEELPASERLEWSVHGLEARLALDLDRPKQAMQAARRAHCLAPDDGASDAIYGLALARLGAPARARRFLTNALVRLDEAPAPAVCASLLSPSVLTRLVHDELDRIDARLG